MKKCNSIPRIHVRAPPWNAADRPSRPAAMPCGDLRPKEINPEILSSVPAIAPPMTIARERLVRTGEMEFIRRLFPGSFLALNHALRQLLTRSLVGVGQMRKYRSI